MKNLIIYLCIQSCSNNVQFKKRHMNLKINIFCALISIYIMYSVDCQIFNLKFNDNNRKCIKYSNDRLFIFVIFFYDLCITILTYIL